MTNKQKIILTTVLLALLATEYVFHSKISEILKTEVTKAISKQKLDVTFDTVDYGYFPPHISLGTVAFKNKNIILSASSISLSIQILPLIKGQIRPNQLLISKANTSITISSKLKTSKKGSLPELQLEEVMKALPFQEIQILNSKAILFMNKDVVDLEIKDASIQKLYSKLQVEISAVVGVRTKDLKDNFHLNTKIRWQKGSFFLNFFTLQKENSIVQLSGSLKEKFIKDFDLNTKDIYQDINELRIKLNLDLVEFNSLLTLLTKKYFPPKTPIHDFSGRVQASGYYYNSQKTNDRSILTLQVDNLKSPFVSLKGLNTKAELTDKELSASLVKVLLSDRSEVTFNDLKIKKQNNSMLLSVDLKSKYLKVEDILTSLNLSAKEISIPVSMDVHCGGLIFKEINLKCGGAGKLLGLDITNSNKSSKIISVNKLSTTFQSLVTKTDFSFSAEASYIDPQTKDSASGTASGSINYITGFDVEFESTPINLNFINEISGQKFSGFSALKGTTQGSSRWGQIHIDLINHDFKFNDLFLGDNTAIVNYKFPRLSFKQIKGSIVEGSNLYTGEVLLDVKDTDLKLDLKGTQITDLGVRTLFFDIFQLPEDIKFDANFSFLAQNGIDLNEMDLDLDSTFSNLDLFNEHFSSAQIHLKGPQGKWNISKGLLEKESSRFKARGYFQGFKEIDARVVSENFKLQDSDFLKSLGVKLTGPALITLNAKGPIEGPEAVGTVSLTNTYGPQKNNMGNSQLGYRLYADSFYFKGNAFNGSVNGEGQYPLSETGSLSFNGEIKKFNVLNFLDINSQNSHDTRLLLWSKPSFKVKDISRNTPKGMLSETKFELISENQILASAKQVGRGAFARPIKFELHQVQHKANLTFDLSKYSRKSIGFDGSLRLEMLKPFIPTCEFINGVFSSKGLKVSSSLSGYTTSGTGSVTQASFKTDSFPYSFNNISADLKLEKNLILFKSIKTALANTHIYGDGAFNLSPSNSSLAFNLNYKKLNIEFPPKISSLSSGTLKLSGDRFPLALSGEVYVLEGLFAQDILTTESSESVTPNKHLPKKILRKSTPPAVLDVKVHIKNKMKIKTNEADGYASGFLRATGNPVDPILSGKIYLTPNLKINFHDKGFRLKEGLLTYKNKLASNPTIFIDASSEIKDNNDPLEKKYTIRMLVKGAASKPDIKFSSQPSLEENQIISLLTIGTVSTQSLGQEITTTEQAAYSGLQFGSYLMQKNQALKDLQKQTGTQIGLSSSVNSGGVNPKVFVKKSWTPKSSSTISQTFGNQKNLSFTTEYKLNKKTSTVLGVQNNQTDDASQLTNRRVQQGVIFDLGLQYKFEFD